MLRITLFSLTLLASSLAFAQADKNDPQAIEAKLAEWLDKTPDPEGLHEFTGFTKLPAPARKRLLVKVAEGLAKHPEWAKDEVQKDWGFTRLHLAAFRGQPGVVRLLLEAGADPNAKALRVKQSFVLPLHVATGLARLPLYESGKPNVAAVVRLLLEHGAKADAPDGAGITPILGAVRGSKDVVELLLAKGASLEARGPEGETPLHLAASAGRLDVVELLLAKGSDPNAHDHRDRTALSQVRNPAVAARLLGAKAKLDHRDADGMSALAHALWRSDRPVVELLRKRGAALDLHTAAAAGDLKAVERLVTKASLVSLARRTTPLQWALRAGHIEATRKLLALGADPNLRDEQGLPLDTALHARALPLVKLLIAAKADPNLQAKPQTDAPVHVAARTGSLKLLEALAPGKPDMNLVGKYRRTPLHVLARNGFSAELVEFALAHGAVVDALDHSKSTALYIAVMTGRHNGPLISALLGAGADPRLTGASGKTAIETAEWAGRKDVAAILRQAAAKKK